MINLKSWLRRHPQPYKLRTDLGKVLMVGDGRSKWADLEATLATLAPQSLEALDANDQVLRATRLEMEDEIEQSTKSSEDRKGQREATYVQIARLLNEAHDAGAKRVGEGYLNCFEKLYALVDILSQRLVGIERAYQAQIDQRASDALAMVEAAKSGGSGPLDGLIGQMVADAMTKQPAAAAAKTPPANGKAK